MTMSKRAGNVVKSILIKKKGGVLKSITREEIISPCSGNSDVSHCGDKWRETEL